MSKFDKLKFSIDIEIDLNPIIDGKISVEQLKTEISHFVKDVTALRAKHELWLTIFSTEINWDNELKKLRNK